jgi:hypothetical protein
MKKKLTPSHNLSDLSKKELKQLEQAVLEQETKKIENTDAHTIKQAVLNLLCPLFICKVSTELERMAQEGGAGQQDADLLFDIMHREGENNAGEAVYEIGCVLDEELGAAGSIYEHRHIFTQLYIAQLPKMDARVKAILRDLKRGVPASTIARQLKEGTFDGKGGTR